MDALTRIGQAAPDFALPDLRGVVHHLSDQRGEILILNFWSAECPWSERADQELTLSLVRWQGQVRLWTIASNANETPQQIQTAAEARDLPVVLLDPNHEVADLYGAVTTPHLFLVDPSGSLRYQGAIDDITFRKRTATQHYLQLAVEALLAGDQPELAETPPYGCTIVRFGSS